MATTDGAIPSLACRSMPVVTREPSARLTSRVWRGPVARRGRAWGAGPGGGGAGGGRGRAGGGGGASGRGGGGEEGRRGRTPRGVGGVGGSVTGPPAWPCGPFRYCPIVALIGT